MTIDNLAAVGSVIGMFVVMILIFVAAFYATKLMGRNYAGQTSSSREMRVIDRLMLGRDRYLLIVEVGEKVLLLGVSPQQIDNLTELDSEAFNNLSPEQENTDFLSLLKNRFKNPNQPG